jgi:small subunit ribosomal protein S3
MIEKDFVTEGLKRTRIDEYLESELERAGYGGMEIQITPLGTMVVVYAERPGMVIGRGGKTVRSITQNLKTNYGLENPQVEVKEVDVPELNPKIMAHKIAAMLQRGMHFRRVAYTALRRIMGSGAQGVEVTISGKIRGARSATAKFNDGYIKKCGEPSTRFVKEGFATVQLKPGVLGIYVRIMPPGMVLPDKVDILKVATEEPEEDTLVETLETEKVEESEEVEDTKSGAISEEIEEETVEETSEEIEEASEEESTEEPEEAAEEEPEEPEEASEEESTEEPEEASEEEPEESEEVSEEPEESAEEEPEKSEETTEEQEEETQEEPEKPE